MSELPRRLAVSIAIKTSGQSQVLIVQRPADDPDLPYAWGLPAASLRPGESWEDAAGRAARGKLGVDVEIGPERNRGTIQRAGYILEMRLFDATIRDGEPAVPQPSPDVTQYQAWRWGTAEDLRPAAGQGSLCCRLYLGV